MKNITIFGKGNMGTVIGKNFEKAGNTVSYVESNEIAKELGDIIVFAVPYAAVAEITSKYANQLEGKVVVDITNPVNFETFDDLLVPSDSSAAAEIAKSLPKSLIVKAFNTTFAATLANGLVASKEKTTVLLASDSNEAKEVVTKSLENSGLAVIDAGLLKRARELEAMGFLQITLAVSEKISWTGGFGILQ